MADYDAVVVGSGINSLACAALLARADWRVCVLERNDWFGGAVKTEELTEPGFLHDVFSAWHPLWVGGAAQAELGDELAARGLEYLNTELPTATAFPDGESAFMLRTAEGNTEELGPEWPGVLERFFPSADLAFGVLGTELWSPAGLALGAKAVRRVRRARAVPLPGGGGGARGGSAAPARSPSWARRCSRAAAGSRRPSPRSARTGCSRPGCCTRGWAPTSRRPGS